MRTLQIEANVGNLSEVLHFAEGVMEESGVDLKSQMQVSLALEELFVNIAQYAYAGPAGPVKLEAGMEGNCFTIVLTDKGIPYDPLEHKDPDITQSAEERPIGGLGILMVKKTMDAFSYRYENGRNITMIQKTVHR